jgi:hypothetical protein
MQIFLLFVNINISLGLCGFLDFISRVGLSLSSAYPTFKCYTQLYMPAAVHAIIQQKGRTVNFKYVCMHANTLVHTRGIHLALSRFLVWRGGG